MLTHYETDKLLSTEGRDSNVGLEFLLRCSAFLIAIALLALIEFWFDLQRPVPAANATIASRISVPAELKPVPGNSGMDVVAPLRVNSSDQ